MDQPTPNQKPQYTCSEIYLTNANEVSQFCLSPAVAKQHQTAFIRRSGVSSVQGVPVV
jgi:hypothetical protein